MEFNPFANLYIVRRNMKTIAKRALYSAVLITAFIMPATSFAQSWEPENAWKVNQDEWNVPSKTSNPPPSKQTPTYNSSNYPSNITPPNSQIPLQYHLVLKWKTSKHLSDANQSPSKLKY